MSEEAAASKTSAVATGTVQERLQAVNRGA